MISNTSIYFSIDNTLFTESRDLTQPEMRDNEQEIIRYAHHIMAILSSRRLYRDDLPRHYLSDTSVKY